METFINDESGSKRLLFRRVDLRRRGRRGTSPVGAMASSDTNPYYRSNTASAFFFFSRKCTAEHHLVEGTYIGGRHREGS